MISLDLEQLCLFELIKASLFDKTPMISNDVNWEKVLDLAKAQSIVPLLASYVPEEQGKEWLAISSQSKAHFIRLMYEQSSLVRLLNAYEIPFIIFKGAASAVYYPLPSLRTYGDIDFYVPDESFALAKDLLERNGYDFIEKNVRHSLYVKNGIEFELHNQISSIHYKNIDALYLNGFSKKFEYKIGNNSFPGLPTYENGIVLIGHIIAHLKEAGIGLRQIIDWMMFVHKELDDSVWYEHFQPLVKEAGFEKLAITVTYMCKKWLGLPDDISWCNDADEELADQLLVRILDDGNFGRSRAPKESIKNNMKREGVFKFLQRSGLKKWSLAQKYAFFRPFAWLYQLFRYVGKGISSLFTGKKVFMKNKHNMSLEDLWDQLY